MTDAELADALASLGIGSSRRLVALLPLVQVAWADGNIQASERKLLRSIARRYDLDEDERTCLDQWLAVRPDEEAFLTARRVLIALLERDPNPEKASDAARSVIAMCESVARAAGGLFNLLFTVDQNERKMLREIAQALSIDRLRAKPDRVVRADATTVLLRAPNPLSEAVTVMLPIPDPGTADIENADTQSFTHSSGEDLQDLPTELMHIRSDGVLQLAPGEE